MKKLFLALIAAISLASCSTDLDVNAEWKDITVVFGLLDASQTDQYIKVNKAFLGPENALVMAMEEDSLYYTPGAITVTLEEYVNGNLSNTYNLSPDTTIAKDSGIFASPNQILYKTSTPLNEEAIYKLVVVKGNDADATVRSETVMVNDFIWMNNLAQFNYKFNAAASVNSPQQLNYRAAKDARRFETRIMFHYLEQSRNNPADSVLKSIEWILPNQTSNTLNGTETILNLVTGEDFLKFIGGSVQEDLTVWRHARAIDVIAYAGADELNTYLLVNGPSASIAQDRPQFSNVQNGQGLLSSRFRKVKAGIDFSKPSHERFACSPFTAGLSFVHYEWNQNGHVRTDTLYTCQ